MSNISISVPINSSGSQFNVRSEMMLPVCDTVSELASISDNLNNNSNNNSNKKVLFSHISSKTNIFLSAIQNNLSKTKHSNRYVGW